MLDGDHGSLQLGVEGDLGEDSAILLGHALMDGNLSVLEPLDERNFGTVANRNVEGVLGHFNEGLRVVDNALNDLLHNCRVKIAVEEGILLGDLDEDILSVEVDDFHLLGGHSAGLAKAKLGNLAALLNRCHVTHKHVVVLAHEEHAVGEGDFHGHLKAFGNDDDEHDDGDERVLTKLGGECITLQGGVGSLLNEQNDERADEDGEGSDESKEFDAATDVSKLVFKFGLLVADVVLDADDTAG